MGRPRATVGRRVAWMVAVAALVRVGASLAATPMAEGDARFIEQAALGAMVDVALGKLSQERAADDRVKVLGSRLSQDRAKALDELRGIAKDKGIDLPAAPDSAAQATIAPLKRLAGTGFDAAYVEGRIAAGRDDVARFQTQAQSGRDAALKAYARKRLPTLREHLALAQATRSALAAK